MVRGRDAGGGLSDAGPADPPEPDSGPVRRCLASGEVTAVETLVRFVIGPDDAVVPDVARRLPGRGMWLSARRDMVELAARKGLFARAARRKVTVPAGLADRIEALLLARCLDWLGLARRAGQAVAGFEKVASTLRSGKAGALVAAADGAADGRAKLRALASGVPLVEVLTAAELAGVFGREHVVHAVVAQGRLARQLVDDAGRLAGFRGEPGGGEAKVKSD